MRWKTKDMQLYNPISKKNPTLGTKEGLVVPLSFTTEQQANMDALTVQIVYTLSQLSSVQEAKLSVLFLFLVWLAFRKESSLGLKEGPHHRGRRVRWKTDRIWLSKDCRRQQHNGTESSPPSISSSGCSHRREALDWRVKRDSTPFGPATEHCCLCGTCRSKRALWRQNSKHEDTGRRRSVAWTLAYSW